MTLDFESMAIGFVTSNHLTLQDSEGFNPVGLKPSPVPYSCTLAFLKKIAFAYGESFIDSND